MKRRLNKEDDYTLGKKIFEQQYVGKYNPKTKLFENKCGGLRNIYKERNLNELKYMKDVLTFPGEYKLKEWQYLYEGLHTSLQTYEMIEKLKPFENDGIIRSIGKDNTDYMIDPEAELHKTTIITFLIDDAILDACENNDVEIAKKIDKLYRIIDGYGYFVASSKPRLDNGIKTNIITIHPLYIIEVTDGVYNELDGILYHVTLKRNWQKIERTGLIPRNSNLYDDNYPDRIYLFPSDKHFRNEALVRRWFMLGYKEKFREMLDENYKLYRTGQISQKRWEYFYNHRYDYRDWVVIKIDLKDKRSYVENDISTHYLFFDDPRSHDGIFTYENIDPQCLSLQKEFHLTDTDDFEYFK